MALDCTGITSGLACFNECYNFDGVSMRLIGLSATLLLAGCGVATNPEEGPIILQCVGEDVNRAGNGEVERERKTVFYRIDGVERTIAKWNEDNQNFEVGSQGLTVTPNELKYFRANPPLAGISSTKTITFDRLSGRVTDEFAMSNNSTITFKALCKPVSDPINAKRKF